MDCRLLSPWGFSRQEYWTGLPCPPPGNLPNPGIEHRSPALQADSLPVEPQSHEEGNNEFGYSALSESSLGFSVLNEEEAVGSGSEVLNLARTWYRDSGIPP